MQEVSIIPPATFKCYVQHSLNYELHRIGYGALVEWYWQAETETHKEKCVQVPLCLPYIPRGLKTEKRSQW